MLVAMDVPLRDVGTDRGVVFAGRDELERLVREQLKGTDIVSELIEERRRSAVREDARTSSTHPHFSPTSKGSAAVK